MGSSESVTSSTVYILNMPQTSATFDRFIANTTSLSSVENRVRPKVVYQPEWQHDDEKSYQKVQVKHFIQFKL